MTLILGTLFDTVCILDGARMMMVVIDGVDGGGGRGEAAGRVGERMAREACRVFPLVNTQKGNENSCL